MEKTLIKEVINIPIASEILWIFVAVGIIFFLSMAWVFHHHWSYYGVGDNPRVFAKSIFWIVSIFLILTMALSATFFEISI